MNFIKMFPMNLLGEGGGAGGNAPAPSAPENVAPPETPDWARDVKFPEGLDEGVRHDPSLKAFVGEDKSINMANLIKSYVHAQKHMGKDKIVVPSKDSDPAEWRKVFNKLGLPETVEDYKLGFQPDKDVPIKNEFIDNFRKVAHEAGILPNQAERMLGFYQEQVKNGFKEIENTRQTSVEQARQELQKEFGEKFEYNVQLANLALRNYGGDEMVAAVKELGLDNDVRLVKFLAKVGQTLGEDDVKDLRQDGSYDKSNMQDEIDAMMNNHSSAYWNKSHPDHHSVVKKVNDYYGKMYR